MFVEIFAVLYELRLKFLEPRAKKAHEAYETAFRKYYKLSDEHVRIRNEQRTMPRQALGEDEKNRIGATGGRRSKALLSMDKREKAVTGLDRRVTRTEARIAYFVAKQQTVPSRRTSSIPAPVGVAVLGLQ